MLKSASGVPLVASTASPVRVESGVDERRACAPITASCGRRRGCNPPPHRCRRWKRDRRVPDEVRCALHRALLAHRLACAHDLVPACDRPPPGPSIGVGSDGFGAGDVGVGVTHGLCQSRVRLSTVGPPGCGTAAGMLKEPTSDPRPAKRWELRPGGRCATAMILVCGPSGREGRGATGLWPATMYPADDASDVFTGIGVKADVPSPFSSRCCGSRRRSSRRRSSSSGCRRALRLRPEGGVVKTYCSCCRHTVGPEQDEVVVVAELGIVASWLPVNAANRHQTAAQVARVGGLRPSEDDVVLVRSKRDPRHRTRPVRGSHCTCGSLTLRPAGAGDESRHVERAQLLRARSYTAICVLTNST